MQPPVGLEVGRGKVWKIHSATYGLGSTCSLWWQLFAKKNKEFGMEPVTTDDCVFICRRCNKVLVISIVVDDILQTGNSKELRLEWLNFMHEFFTVSNDVQTPYIDKLHQNFGLDQAYYKDVPMDPNFSLSWSDIPMAEEADPRDVKLYRELVG
eukprot:717625-Rhodomonas_salina.2